MGLRSRPFLGASRIVRIFLYMPNKYALVQVATRVRPPWAGAVAPSWVQVAWYEFFVKAKQAFLFGASRHPCTFCMGLRSRPVLGASRIVGVFVHSSESKSLK